MPLNSEQDQLQHSLARHIPPLIWTSVFSGKMSDAELSIMESPLGTVLPVFLSEDNSQLKALLCLFVGHPDISNEDLLQIALQIGAPQATIADFIAMTGKSDMLLPLAAAHPGILQRKEMLQWASKLGHIGCINEIIKLLPQLLLEDMIAADNYAAFSAAARNNDRFTMEIFIALITPENVAKMISVFHWEDICDALDNGKLDALECLIRHAPRYVADMIESYLPGMIDSDRGKIFALLFNHSILEWFVSYVGEERFSSLFVKPLSTLLSYTALFKDKPDSLYLLIEKLLALVGPAFTADLLEQEHYEPFRLAAVKGDRNLMNIYLANIPPENRARMIKSCFPEDAQILQRIDRVEEKYAHPEDKINDNAYLWVAKKEGVAPVYILGSCHRTSQDTQIRFVDMINVILDKVETSFTEIMTTVVAEPDGIDDLVRQRASIMNKTQKRLENLRSTILMYGEKMFRDLLRAVEISKDDVTAEWNYLTNISAPQEILENSGLGHVASLRNKYWMEDILNESANQKPCMVTVGSMHNQGIFGLPNLLANEGYSLTPLAKTAPTPKSVLLRDLLTRSNSNFFFKFENILPQATAGSSVSIEGNRI